MMIQQVSTYFQEKKMQYELLFGLSILQPWEKFLVCKY